MRQDLYRGVHIAQTRAIVNYRRTPRQKRRRHNRQYAVFGALHSRGALQPVSAIHPEYFHIDSPKMILFTASVYVPYTMTAMPGE
jgi:hypothetical protein